MVTFNEYLNEINKRYANYPSDRRSNVYANCESVQAAMGLSSEVGEVQDLLLKSWMYNRQLDTQALTLELGDVFHYLLRLADIHGISLHVMMERNLDKLAKRDHFNGDAG